MCKYPDSNMKVPAHSVRSGDIICVGSKRFTCAGFELSSRPADEPEEPACIILKMKNCKGSYSIPFAMDVMIPIYREDKQP